MQAKQVPQTQYFLRWVFGLFWVVFFTLASPGCSGLNPQQEGTNPDGGVADYTPPAIAPPALPPATLQQRACPDKLVTKTSLSFTNTPCQKDSRQSACTTGGCQPSKVPTTASTAPSGFFNDCSKPEILCVGPQGEVKTLTEASQKVATESAITTVLVARGVYNESVTFQNVQRALRIVGESNDAADKAKGTWLIAPKPTGTAADYAALRLVNMSDVTIERMVISGQGNGIYADNCVKITITNNHHTVNLRAGLWVNKGQNVTITQSRFVKNGGQLNTSGATPYWQDLDFGIKIVGVPTVDLRDNEVSSNGAGGVWISSDSTIGITITNNHRIGSDDNIAITITNNHRTTLEGNLIHHNGPVGIAGYPTKLASCQCPQGYFCEGGACHLALVDDTNGKQSAVGLGLVLAGQSQATLRGNSLFGNDTGGILIHSVGQVTFQHNALERNGVRPETSNVRLADYAFPALKMVSVRDTVTLEGNLIVDNVKSGVSIQQSAKAQKGLSVKASNNHLGGNGRFLTGERNPVGNGLMLLASQQGPALSFAADNNVFRNNGRAGFASEGSVSGLLQTNLFQNHPFRGVVVLDTGNAQTQIRLAGNTIDGARGFGVQVYGGGAVVQIAENAIQGIQPVQQTGTNLEADAIGLTNLTSKATVEKNLMTNNTRVGLLLDNTAAEVSNNAIQGSQYAVITQKGASVTGTDQPLAQTPAQPLPNTKTP